MHSAVWPRKGNANCVSGPNNVFDVCSPARGEYAKRDQTGRKMVVSSLALRWQNHLRYAA